VRASAEYIIVFLERIMMERLFRPLFNGVAEIDSQIEKFRHLRASVRPDVHAKAGTWTMGPYGPKKDMLC